MIKGNSYSGDNIGGIGDGSPVCRTQCGEVVLNAAQQNTLAQNLGRAAGLQNLRLEGSHQRRENPHRPQPIPEAERTGRTGNMVKRNQYRLWQSTATTSIITVDGHALVAGTRSNEYSANLRNIEISSSSIRSWKAVIAGRKVVELHGGVPGAPPTRVCVQLLSVGSKYSNRSSRERNAFVIRAGDGRGLS